MPNYWPGQQPWPGSSSCSVRQCCRNLAGAGSGAFHRTGALQRPGALREYCRGRIRSVAASGSVTGVLQAGSGALQCPEALQECCRGRIRSVAASGSVTGALQGQVTLSRYQDRSRARFVTLQGSLTRIGYQVCCRGRICHVTGTLRGLVLLRKTYVFLHET